MRLHPEAEAWVPKLCRADPDSADLVAEAIDLLAEQGPALGRPLVDRGRIENGEVTSLETLRA